MTASHSHSFIVPAYGESPYLESCLRSLRQQTEASEIAIATSTPNEYIALHAETYGIPIFENPVRNGIGSDWNFALGVANTPWVTLAHQDDVYLPRFAEMTIASVKRNPAASLVFCDYREIEGEEPRSVTSLIRIKKLLLELSFLGSSRAGTRFFKTNALRFGCAIPCPAVTINSTTGLRFSQALKVDLDWDAWLDLATRPGDFVYVRESLMFHRVHKGSETTSAIGSGLRSREDEMMFCRMWPEPLARLLSTAYRASYGSNQTVNDEPPR